uniref:7TM_GPCR_Srx domain-containing protein n=1 Tax=Strongyloides papillosus TaxID=174720 RepID=A0A0N5BK86_STREA
MVNIPTRGEFTKYVTIETILAGLILLFLSCAILTETIYVSFDAGFSFGFMIVWHQFPSSIFSTIFSVIVFIYNALIILIESSRNVPVWRSDHRQKLIVQGCSMVLIFIVALMNSILSTQHKFYNMLYKSRLIAISIFCWLTFVVQILQLIKYFLEMKNFNVNFKLRSSNAQPTGNDRNNVSGATISSRTETSQRQATFSKSNDIQVEIDPNLEVQGRNN